MGSKNGPPRKLLDRTVHRTRESGSGGPAGATGRGFSSFKILFPGLCAHLGLTAVTVLTHWQAEVRSLSHGDLNLKWPTVAPRSLL